MHGVALAWRFGTFVFFTSAGHDWSPVSLPRQEKDDKRRLPSSQNLLGNPFTLVYMSSQCNSRKRQRPDQDSLHQSQITRSKRQKCSDFPVSQLPPEFWDNLSQLWLTKGALRELDRRNRLCSKRLQPSQIRTHRPVTRNFLAAIKLLAEKGGPNISDLRGVRTSNSNCLLKLTLPEYPQPNHLAMSSSESSFRGRRARGSQSTSKTRRTTNTTSTKSTGPYDRDFQQNLVDGGVYPDRYRFPDGRAPPKPDNWDEMNQRAMQYRASLSPSKFSDGAHEEFVQADADAKKEDQVTKSVIPIIEGRIRDAKCVSGKIPFRNLAPLTDGTLVPGNPDLYYGARPEQLNRRVRDDLSNQIIPSTQDDLPIAPNFFLAAKGPDGSLAVAGRQASYDATFGERGQVSLGLWEQDEKVFDNKAHTITSIYHGGQLKLYSVHAAQPNGLDTRPDYYMHQIKAFAMTSDTDTFRKGASAFRNLRDYAEEQRNTAIQRANERASMIDNDEVDVLDEVDNEELQIGSSDATFSFACGTSNSIPGALSDEQESETSVDDTYVPPPAKRVASQARRSRRRKLQIDEFSN
jgi:hypothetical protein